MKIKCWVVLLFQLTGKTTTHFKHILLEFMLCIYIYILLFNRYKASSWHNVVFYCRFQGQTDMMVRKANQQQIELISAIYIYFQVVNYYSSAFLFQFLILNKPSLWWATILGNSANIKQYTYGHMKNEIVTTSMSAYDISNIGGE